MALWVLRRVLSRRTWARGFLYPDGERVDGYEIVSLQYRPFFAVDHQVKNLLARVLQSGNSPRIVIVAGPGGGFKQDAHLVTYVVLISGHVGDGRSHSNQVPKPTLCNLMAQSRI